MGLGLGRKRGVGSLKEMKFSPFVTLWEDSSWYKNNNARQDKTQNWDADLKISGSLCFGQSLFHTSFPLHWLQTSPFGGHFLFWRVYL